MNKKKQKESNFLLTVNPNKSKEKLGVNNLKQAVEWFGHQLNMFLDIVEPGGSLDGSSNSIQAGLEISPTFHALHTHILIRVKHYTKIQLNLARVRWFFKQALHINTDVYVNVKIVPSGVFNATKYIFKNPLVKISTNLKEEEDE